MPLGRVVQIRTRLLGGEPRRPRELRVRVIRNGVVHATHRTKVFRRLNGGNADDIGAGRHARLRAGGRVLEHDALARVHAQKLGKPHIDKRRDKFSDFARVIVAGRC